MTSPTSPSTPRLRPATIAGRYRLERKLGAGSMGSVYLARDEETGQEVALKMLRAEELLAGSLDRLQAEFQAIASLRHPRIAQAFDFGYARPGSIPFYTREYIAGVPLPSGPPGGEPPEDFLRPVLDLLEGLDHLHARGLLHLDVHAGNLIVASDAARGSVLIDIGLAPSPARSAHRTSGGSWPQLPPELARGEALTPATDLFLVGRLLLFRLTGRTGGGPVLPREIPGWGTRRTLEIERILERALQPAPAARFTSAGDFREALNAALGAEERRPRRGELSPPALVGRAAELKAIDAVIAGAQAGEARVLSLVSRRGLGKSRLLAEARVRAQVRGLSTIEARFLPDPAPEPALFAVLRRARRQPGSGSTWLDLLDPRCGGTPAERAERAAEAYFHEEGPPLAILIDDLDLADPESRRLVAALAAQADRRQTPEARARGLVLIVASERELLKGSKRRRAIQVRVLRPLSARDSRQLLFALLAPSGGDRFLARRALRQARGSPLLLRRLAHAIRAELEAPRPGSPHPSPAGPTSSVGANLEALPEAERDVLAALAVIARAATAVELSAALDRPAAEVARSLRRLLGLEAVAAQGRGDRRRYQVPDLDAAGKPAGGAARRRARSMHRRLAALLLSRRRRGAPADPRDQENLARHLLALGDLAGGREAALSAAGRLRDRGAAGRAVRLLEELAGQERHAVRRFAVCERICEALEPTGDHERIIAVLEPFLRRPLPRLPAGLRVRLCRRLGISHHRAGAPRDALRLLAEASALAHPRRDLEDLIFIDSELAEIHIFQGSLGEAEAACRRGLERLRTWGAPAAARGRMEVMLRASLGHIHLRRLSLPAARAELMKALALSQHHGASADRAAILHNLGVAENQLHQLPAARRRFRAAERLLARSGEHRNLIKVSTNLAVIAAKQGRREEAEEHVERAEAMLRRFPGRQLECFAAYSRGFVRLLCGDSGDAAAAFERAAALAHGLGDRALESFSRAYRAEALTLMGHYGPALETLRRLAGGDAPGGAPLRRLVLIRLHLVEALLGSTRSAARRRRDLEIVPREDLAFLRAWNDLLHGLGLLAAGEEAQSRLASARREFAALRVPAGERFAGAALALAGVPPPGAAPAIREVPDGSPVRHAFLDVAEPLFRAAAALAAGETEGAERWLSAASAAIVGKQFLELDLHLELLRARIATRKGETREARRHLHRVLSSRDLLLRFVPARYRQRFLRQPRFAALGEVASRVKPSPALWHSTERLRGAGEYAGMIGRSPPMLSLFAALERLRDQELSVLITGETGTGKELVARAIVQRGPRAERPFQTVHCACLPPELFESEFFGREAGAFTGAERSEPGLVEAVAGGTLLLDEVSVLALESQAKLLRFLDAGSYRRVGGAQPRRADVRILATTAADLQDLAARGKFRADLYWRLAGVELKLPALRERREDIDLLARHFLERHARRLDREAPAIDGEALAWLRGREWPGNVRELETGLFRALLHLPAGAGRMARADLEAHFPPPTAEPVPGDLLARPLAERRRELDRRYLTQLFLRERGDRRAMMRALGVKTTKLYQWFRDLGLDLRELRRRLDP